jgi:uncharacterized protein YdeI (YjbR/CyaY-like superfamily)
LARSDASGVRSSWLASPKKRRICGKLSNSMRRYHVDNINGAKSADTRQRRIDKAIALFLDGKQR